MSSDEAILLRSTSAGRDALMEETLGVRVKSVSPVDVLRRMKDEIAEPVLAKMRSHESDAEEARALAASVSESGQVKEAELQAELNAARTEQDRLAQERTDIDDAIDNGARRTARIRIRAGLWVLAGLLVTATALKLVSPPWLDDMPAPILWVIGGLAIVATALAIIETLGRGTVAAWLKPMESRLADRLIRKRRKALGPP